jgi:hypothetical protein
MSIVHFVASKEQKSIRLGFARGGRVTPRNCRRKGKALRGREWGATVADVGKRSGFPRSASCPVTTPPTFLAHTARLFFALFLRSHTPTLPPSPPLAHSHSHTLTLTPTPTALALSPLTHCPCYLPLPSSVSLAVFFIITPLPISIRCPKNERWLPQELSPRLPLVLSQGAGLQEQAYTIELRSLGCFLKILPTLMTLIEETPQVCSHRVHTEFTHSLGCNESCDGC